MARIIAFSDYLKSVKSKSQIMNSIDYNGQREGVQLNDPEMKAIDTMLQQPLDKVYEKYPVSTAQKLLIEQTLEAMPLLEKEFYYQDLAANPTMYHASVFITEAFEKLAENDLSNQIYLNYISTRPGVQINQDTGELSPSDIIERHGLFDDTGSADINKIRTELSQHTGNVWRDIISIRRSDAEALGYDDQLAWRQLLNAHMPKLAEQMKIPAKDFRWCAAFHDESYHPHVHIMCWDAKGENGFKDKEAIRTFKSALANDIFSNEMYLHKELKYIYRKDLEANFENKVDDILTSKTKLVTDGLTDYVKESLIELSKELNDTGKKVYAYQSPEAKALTDDIVGKFLTDKNVKPLLIQYLKSSKELSAFYRLDTDNYVKEELEKMLHPKKNDRKVLQNIIIKTAYEIKANDYQQQVLLHKRYIPLLYKIQDDNRFAMNQYSDDEVIRATIKSNLRFEVMGEELREYYVRINSDRNGKLKDGIQIFEELTDTSKEKLLDDYHISKVFHYRKYTGTTKSMVKQAYKEIKANGEQYSDEDRLIMRDSYDPNHLLNAAVKMCIALEMSPSDIVENVNAICSDKEKVLMSILENKETKLQQRDVILLNRIYNENIMMPELDKEINIHAAAKMIYSMLNFMRSDSIENQQELARLNRVRRIDEMEMRKSQMK